MYDELVKRLRELASIPEHCENVADCDQCSKEDICLSFTNKRIIEVATQAADAIEELARKEKFHAFLWNTIQPNEMEQYLSMYRAQAVPSEPPKEESYGV